MVACTPVCTPNAPAAMAYPPLVCACLDDALIPAPAPAIPLVPTGAVQVAADTIRITFNGGMTATPQADPGAFSIALVGAPTVAVVTVYHNGNIVNVLFAPSTLTFTSGTVTYAPTGTGDLKSAAHGTSVAGFTIPVTPMPATP